VKFHSLALICILLIASCIIFNTQAFSVIITDKDVSLETVEDPHGLVSLNPYGDNGIYFTDDGTGAYVLDIGDIPQENIVYGDVFSITNNLQMTTLIKVLDIGDYSSRVTFSANGHSLESEGYLVDIGTSIYVDISIDATSLPNASLLDSINIIAYHDGEEVYTISRGANLVTEGGEAYDPLSHDMPSNAEYLRLIALDILDSGGEISEGQSCFEDMGLDPDVWSGNINGYTYYYYSDNNGIIYIKNILARIRMKYDGSTMNVNKNNGIRYSVHGSYYYVKYRGNWYSPATIFEYY